MRKLVSMTIVLLLCIMQVFAQDKTVTGKVTDEKDGTPLAGVSVTVKGTSVGCTTGADGRLRLSVPSTARVLIFSSINFATQEVSIGNKSEFSVKLVSEEKALSEVVVVGFFLEERMQVLAWIGIERRAHGEKRHFIFPFGNTLKSSARFQQLQFQIHARAPKVLLENGQRGFEIF